MKTIHKVMIATAFSATVAAAFTGVAVSSETTQPIATVDCSEVYWPMIPAECMQNDQSRDVRLVAFSGSADDPMQTRFHIGFQ